MAKSTVPADEQEVDDAKMEKCVSKNESVPVYELCEIVELSKEESGLPELSYELTPKRKRSIAIQMTFIIGVNTIAPTLIFFLYKHLAGNYDVNPALTYTWVTLALGVS